MVTLWPHKVKILLCRKKKISNKILKTKSINKLNKLKDEFNEIENTLKECYERQRYRKECEVISNLKDNPRIFYKLARTKSVVQSDVGPLKDRRGSYKTDKWSMSEVLSEQYYGIGQDPRRNLEDKEFLDELNAPMDGIDNIVFGFKEVQEILSKPPLKSGPGPDGLPPNCLKYGGSQVV